jgi:tetratricopeptide (TPR) repeat protein
MPRSQPQPGRPSLAEALDRALSCQQQGKLPEAERLCLDILQAEPGSCGAQHLLGLLRHQQGRTEEALKLIAAAIESKPQSAPALCSYGLVLQDLGRHDEALASYDRALTIRPNDAEVLNNRGTALTALQRHGEALASYRRALAIRPGYAEAYYNCAITLTALERHEEALASYDKALAIVPDALEILYNRAIVQKLLERHEDALASYDKLLAIRPDHADALYHRGVVLNVLNRHEDALASYRKALAISPQHAEAHYNCGVSLDNLGRHQEALASYDRALALRPDHVAALNNRALALEELDRPEEALASYEKALALRSDNAEVLNNRGTTLIELARFEEALASYDQALAVKPDDVECRANRSLLLLRLGLFEEGWREFEARRKKDDWVSRNLAGPEWAGEAAAGQRLLVYSERGLGDTIQFARFADAVAATGRKVVLEVQPPLRALLSSLEGVTIVRSGEALPEFDCHLPLMSLPHLLGTTLADVPADVPYLAADRSHMERMSKRLSADAFNVGIVWQGNPNPNIDKGRSIPLRLFAPLCRIPGVNLISLQKNTGAEQLTGLPSGMTVSTLGDDFDLGPDAFLDAAAAIMHLDLVIASDTAIAHLAGALGRPVWIALKHVPDWRWMTVGEETPWYPTARLFRQIRPGDWEEVVGRIASELAVLVSAKKRSDHSPGQPADAAMATNNTGMALVPISYGELIDKITILEIKSARIQDPRKAANVLRELELLIVARAQSWISSEEADHLTAELRRINESLWDTEDQIRDCEREKDFGPTFIALARSIYRTNDRRAAVKRQINELAGSALIEEKSYHDFS